MNLTGTRPWVVGSLVLALLMAGLTWLLVVGPTRSDIASLHDDTLSAQTQNDVLAAKTAALKKLSLDRSDLVAQVSQALSSLPADTDIPSFNREIAQHATERGVQVTSIAVAAATAPGSGAADPAGLLAVPVTIEASGERLALLYFLRDLQEVGPRAALVGSVSVSADAVDATADPAAGGTGAEVDETETIGNTVPTTMTAQVTVFSHALSANDSALLASATGISPDAG